MNSTLKKLVRLRQEAGVTQAEIARRMKVSRQQVYNLETGRQGEPSLKTLERYARAIGMKIVVEIRAR